MKGNSSPEIEWKNHARKIMIDRERNILTTLFCLKGRSAIKMTPNTIEGELYRPVTMNKALNSTNASSGIIIS